MNDERYYTITEAMKTLNVSRTTIWRWIREKKIRSTKFHPGRTSKRRIPASDIDAMKLARTTT